MTLKKQYQEELEQTKKDIASNVTRIQMAKDLEIYKDQREKMERQIFELEKKIDNKQQVIDLLKGENEKLLSILEKGFSK